MASELVQFCVLLTQRHDGKWTRLSMSEQECEIDIEETTRARVLVEEEEEEVGRQHAEGLKEWIGLEPKKKNCRESAER